MRWYNYLVSAIAAIVWIGVAAAKPSAPNILYILADDLGYRTACIGKWHLGLDLPTTDGKKAATNGSNVDWKSPLADSPVHHGFDFFYGISASLDMPPYIYIENDRFVGECTTEKAFHRKGPAHADFEGVDVLPKLGRQAVACIERQEADRPFFLCVALTSPHTPILPSPATAGEDSVSFLAALRGDPIVSTRKGVIHHSIRGHFACRQGKWKLLLARGSGGWTAPNEKMAAENGSPSAQLYDMDNDPGKATNLYATHPEVAARLLSQLEADVRRGRSTAGNDVANDADPVVLWKSGT